MVLSNLRRTYPIDRHHNDPAYFPQLDELLTETTQQGKTLVQHFSDKAKDALKEIAERRKSSERIDALRNAVSHAATGKLAVGEIRPMPSKKRYHDSEDSQATAVSTPSEYPVAYPHVNDRRDVATQTTYESKCNFPLQSGSLDFPS